MEKRVNDAIAHWTSEWKQNARAKYDALGLPLSPSANEWFQYLYNYPPLALARDDIVPRKRGKSTVPLHARCCAMRASNEQCTRRRKNGEPFCGTHLKGTPYGISSGCVDSSGAAMSSTSTAVPTKIVAQEIQGILQYIDPHGNVYSMEDVLANRQPPRKVGLYRMTSDEGYVLTEYFDVPSVMPPST